MKKNYLFETKLLFENREHENIGLKNTETMWADAFVNLDPDKIQTIYPVMSIDGDASVNDTRILYYNSTVITIKDTMETVYKFINLN
jgi:hypothetical protein